MKRDDLIQDDFEYYRKYLAMSEEEKFQFNSVVREPTPLIAERNRLISEYMPNLLSMGLVSSIRDYVHQRICQKYPEICEELYGKGKSQ